MVKVLIIGNTGKGKTLTSLTLSKHFRTIYYDVDLGTDPWDESLHFKEWKNLKVLRIRDWEDYKRTPIGEVSKKNKPDLVVVDSLSELFGKYKDYLKQYVRKTGRFPMPVATGVVDLTKKGINPEFVSLPYQMYSLLYDTIEDVASDAVSYSDHTIITMHPLETRMAVQKSDGSSEIVHSSAKLGFLQRIYRKVDVIIKLSKPMRGEVVKSRGDLKPVEGAVDPVEFLKRKMGIGGDEDVSR